MPDFDRDIFFSEVTSALQASLCTDGRSSFCLFSHKSIVWANSYIKKIIKDLGDSHRPIELDDGIQQISLLYIEAEHQYDQRRPETGFRSYVVRRIAWGLRDWLIKRAHIIYEYPYYYFTEERPDFLLDVNFLIYGTSIYPFSELSPYERYLIFLHFREEKSILEISYIVQHKWDTVKLRLENTIEKLRSLVNEKQNTGRSCDGTDRFSATRRNS